MNTESARTVDQGEPTPSALARRRAPFSRRARAAGFLIFLLLAVALPAAEAPQNGRFLLIFETSPVLKKSLPLVRQIVGALFAGNFQNEIKADDDLAVWTVDQTVHAGTYATQPWSPDDAAAEASQLTDFLRDQHFTRHATLASIQPLLNRVVKSSDELTVLVFCDGQSRLSGTPYDAGINEMITNTTARAKGSQTLFLIVLRAYHGQYLGCSVNHSMPLNFPKFPAPPKPPPAVAPPPPVTPAPAVTRPSGPVVNPLPALIIVGTNASTNIANPPPPAAVAPPPASKPAVTNAFEPPTASPGAAPAVAALAPAPPPPSRAVTNFPPVSPVPTPAPAPVASNPVSVLPPPPPPATSPTPATVSQPPPELLPAAPGNPPSNNVLAAPAEASPPAVPPPGNHGTALIAGGALLAVAVIVLWLVLRARRPHSSLITSSMQDDPRLPPRK